MEFLKQMIEGSVKLSQEEFLKELSEKYLKERKIWKTRILGSFSEGIAGKILKGIPKKLPGKISQDIRGRIFEKQNLGSSLDDFLKNIWIFF